MKARFEHKYAAFLDRLESDLQSVLGADIVRNRAGFTIKDRDMPLLELYPLSNNCVNIFIRDERVRGRIHIVADAYINEFSVECSISRQTALKWQANARKQQA